PPATAPRAGPRPATAPRPWKFPAPGCESAGQSVSHLTFSHVMLPLTPLTPCGRPAGRYTTSPTLIGCDSPPTNLPLSTRPPVVSVPEPSSPTHRPVVFGWINAVSAFVVRRLLMLNFPPSI